MLSWCWYSSSAPACTFLPITPGIRSAVSWANFPKGPKVLQFLLTSSLSPAQKLIYFQTKARTYLRFSADDRQSVIVLHSDIIFLANFKISIFWLKIAIWPVLISVERSQESWAVTKISGLSLKSHLFGSGHCSSDHDDGWILRVAAVCDANVFFMEVLEDQAEAFFWISCLVRHYENACFRA